MGFEPGSPESAIASSCYLETSSIYFFCCICYLNCNCNKKKKQLTTANCNCNKKEKKQLTAARFERQKRVNKRKRRKNTKTVRKK